VEGDFERDDAKADAERAIQPNRRGLRRGGKRAVFIDDEVAKRFGSDDQLEQALRALLQASDHVRKAG